MVTVSKLTCLSYTLLMTCASSSPRSSVAHQRTASEQATQVRGDALPAGQSTTGHWVLHQPCLSGTQASLPQLWCVWGPHWGCHRVSQKRRKLYQRRTESKSQTCVSDVSFSYFSSHCSSLSLSLSHHTWTTGARDMTFHWLFRRVWMKLRGGACRKWVCTE